MSVAACLVALTMAAAAATEPVDPDALAVLLADLEASGGMLTDADLALFRMPPVPSARGRWMLAVTGHDGAPPRVDLLAERHAVKGAFRLRARHHGDRNLLAAWIRSSVSHLTMDLGGGAMVHGAGLLAAPPGRRATLDPDRSLLPPRPGWRPSTAAEPGATVRGGALSWTSNHLDLGVGVARDQAGIAANHARAGLSTGPASLAAVVVQRGAGRGLGLDLRWRRGPWLLAAEMARWRRGSPVEPGQAWQLAGSWRTDRWRAEIQAAASNAPAGLDGAARPACLPGWRGRGWALRVVTRPAAQFTASLVVGHGRHRDPHAATGMLADRSQLALRLRRTSSTGPFWEVNLRRTAEGRRRWDTLQPWLPAATQDRRLRTWLTAAVTLPVTGGSARITGRRLEEAAESRSLLSAIWNQRRPWGRWRAGVQLAWGAPLDLVAVSAPVSGLVRLRHWGHWRSGLLIGADGGGRWRWQCGGEVRRRSDEAGGDLTVDVHAGWGRSF